MNCMLPSENIVKITKFIHPCTKCDGGRGWTGNKGYQYPLEEAWANAFALQEIDEQRKGLYGASPKSHIIRILTRTSHWLSAGIGYCHGGEFDGSPGFDAGLRDL